MSSAPDNIVLAGFMGSGKSVVGRHLSALLGWRLVDLDEHIAGQAAGASVAQLFEREGEQGFREREARAIAGLLGARRTIVATGGGAVVRPENRRLLHRLGPIVCLEAPPSELWARVAADPGDRPLARDRAAFMDLLDRRKAVYRDLPYHVPTRGCEPMDIAAAIARGFVGPAFTVNVPLGERAYDVYVAPGALGRLGERLAGHMKPGPCLVLSHAAIWKRFGEGVDAVLRAAGWRPHVELVPPGEGTKSLSRAIRLYDAMAAAGLERRNPVIAVGGGVIGDLGGFLAATYLRGVPFVQVPTTLLAQIDSSVGGKVAVNLAAGKNLVGAFHQPASVVADPLVLHTLPPRQFRAGLAELIKYGAILDAGLFATIESRLRDLHDRDLSVLVPLIARACELKAQVVAADEREGGLRRILNFGHTVGHAIEAVAGYGNILHGEAVAIGMVAAARLGALAGTCGAGVAEKLAAVLGAAGLPTATDLSPDRLVAAMATDKKVADGRVSWVLPTAIGSVTVRDDVSPADV
ncbi:MAG: 3-dehydroquinate synthase, partial [Candidatus Sericytochromatia bacterium]|nr:3-dehydroquinate synthase [Candidatus Tanganyikabacteria bacterium]